MKSQDHISNKRSSFWLIAYSLVIAMIGASPSFASSPLRCDQVFSEKNGIFEQIDIASKAEVLRTSFRDLYPVSDLEGVRTLQSYERILSITLHLLSQYQKVLSELGIPSKVLSPDRLMALSLLDQQKSLEEKYSRTKSPFVKVTLDFIQQSIQDLMKDKMYIRNQFLKLKSDVDLAIYFPVLEISNKDSSLPLIQSLKKYSIDGVPLRIIYSPLLSAEALFNQETNRLYNSGDSLVHSGQFMNEDLLHELIHVKLMKDRSLGKEDFYSVVFRVVPKLENIAGMSKVDAYVQKYLQQQFSLEELLTAKKTIAWQNSSDQKFQESRKLSPSLKARLASFWVQTHTSMSQTALVLVKDLRSELKTKSESEVLAMTDLRSHEEVAILENQRFHLYFESEKFGRVEVVVEISKNRIEKYLSSLPKSAKPELKKIILSYLKDVQENIQRRHLRD